MTQTNTREEIIIYRQKNSARFIFHGFEGAVLHMKVVKSIEPFRAFRSYLTEHFKNIKALEKSLLR